MASPSRRAREDGDRRRDRRPRRRQLARESRAGQPRDNATVDSGAQAGIMGRAWGLRSVPHPEANGDEAGPEAAGAAPGWVDQYFEHRLRQAVPSPLEGEAATDT